MGTPLDDRRSQALEVIERLADSYPDPTISLEFSTRHELLVAVVLSAQCTDERVNDVTAELFEQYPDVEAYANASQDELAEALNSVTYFNNKASYIRSAAETILEDHEGEVPDTMRELTELSGVGRKTANVVLQHGHDVVEGIVVDTHVMRLSQRLGLTEASRPAPIETDLMELLPEDDWQEFTHWCIAHGRETCSARNPDCEDCVLEGICPSSKADSETDLASGESWG